MRGWHRFCSLLEWRQYGGSGGGQAGPVRPPRVSREPWGRRGHGEPHRRRPPARPPRAQQPAERRCTRRRRSRDGEEADASSEGVEEFQTLFGHSPVGNVPPGRRLCRPTPSHARVPTAGPRVCGGSMSVARGDSGPSAASKYSFLGGRGERTGRDPSDTHGCSFLIEGEFNETVTVYQSH
jgi:hypothetical protein